MPIPSILATLRALLAVAFMLDPAIVLPAPIPGTRVEVQPPE